MGISALDFLGEYFMNQLNEFAAIGLFIIQPFPLFVFDLQQGKVVLEQCPGTGVCAHPCGR